MVLSSSICGELPAICCPLPTNIMWEIGPVDIDNLDDQTHDFDYVVLVHKDSGDPDLADVGLNGQEPGVPVMGHLNLLPGQHAPIDLAATFWHDEPFHAYSVVVMADIDGDGIPTAIASTTIRNRLADDCPADIDGSGFVDTDDFTCFVHLFEAGDVYADFDGSGFADTDDYDAFIHAFELGW